MEQSRNTLLALSALPALLLLSSCGGGGSSSGPAFNATGYWMTWITDPGTSEETGPMGSYLMQSGGAVDGVSVSGTVSGNNLTANVEIPGLSTLLQFSGNLSGQSILGYYTLIGFPLSAAFRMQPFTPTGTADASGTVNGLAIDFDTTTAFGERSYSDEALTVLTDVMVVHDDGTIRFELQFDPTSLAVGVIDASVETVAVYAGNDTSGDVVTATSGTVTVTQYDASGFAGTFNLTLPASESISGSFDVAYDLEAYEPP